ncbi:MAG: glycosyltransferase [Elusimicrobia bacterium]|nr:glycosyltransferase [Elusimicrobiota bacterium]
MSSIDRKSLLALFLLALALRAGLAVLTESHPIFPAFHYTDAEIMDQGAWGLTQAWEKSLPYEMPGSTSQRIHLVWLALIYRIVGHVPLAAKLVNALFGALSVWAFFRLCLPVFGASQAFLAAGVLACWPSHVFFTSQNFKDALIFFSAYLALGSFLRPEPSFLAGIPAFVAMGLLRPYLAFTASLAVASASVSRKALAALLLAPAAFLLAFQLIFSGPLAVPGRSSGLASQLPLVRSPQALSDFRKFRQDADRDWARIHKNREIASQIFYGIEFHGWLDVLLFLPRGVFYVLFMPLPFLYPLGHKLGRVLASGENTFMLVLSALACLGIWKSGASPRKRALIVFFLAMAAGSALFEFDLGSATRHRLLYLPMLFPFAFWWARPRRSFDRGRKIKVLQTLECGGPGGTGNQAAALCNHLDARTFEPLLAYASRESDPETYRAQAGGAKKAFHVPEMVREISPVNDMKALIKLYRLFQKEEPDIVHAHSSKAGFLARLAAWAAGVPKIFYSPHGYGFLQEDRSWAARKLYWVLEFSVSWIGEIVAVSPSEAALARGLAWGKPVHIVCDACLGEALEAEPSKDGETRVGSCGRLAPARQPEAFLNLCQRLTDSRNRMKCVWIGDGELAPKFKAELQNMNLLSRVEVTGWLEPAAARKRMRGLDVFVHYSRWDAFPNAVLEAMALGIPVVASDIPGNRDLVVHGQTGYLAKSEVELLEYCLKLVDNPGLRKTLGWAGRERALKEFSLKETITRLEKLYLI